MSGRLLAGRAAQVLAGLLAAAALAEGAFWLRDRGAFPHVNFYVADAKLGVRLRPGATERISFGGNPVTHVRVNADGYRGAELGPPRPEEILVVGDSQAFGLGVEEGETFAARLGASTGRPVVNAGVPTYGPDEYDAVVEEMLARRRPSIVVYTVNVANDLFEAERPNRERHVVWDGWAVRKESAPPASSSFPGRGWLFGRSHLMFAWRKKLHERQQAEGVDRGFASEGTWTDLVGAGRGAAGAREKARDEHRDKTKRDAAARTEAEREAAVEEERLAEAADLQKLGITLDEKLQDIGYTQEWLRTARASAGDIVQIDEGEESRSIPVTADLINRAGLFRRQLETALRTHRADVAAGGPADEAWELFQSWEKAADKLGTLRRSATQLLRHSSPLLPHVARLGQLCAAHGARLVVLVLPLDVMVSPAEWAKYGAAPRDMAPARRLVEDLARASEEHGLNALDATDALAAAEPGAFLNRDLHLSPKGHEAVARALAIAINQSPPEMPTGALADGRSLPPGPDGWERSARTPGAKQAGCSVFRSLEWIRVLCYDFAHRGGTPGGVSLLRGGQGDAMTFTSPHAMLLVAPWPPDDDLAADFFWSNGVERFEIVPHLGMRFTSRPASGEGPKGPSALEKKLMACAGGGELKLRDLQLGADPDCARTYGDDCARLLECAQGDPASPPDCPPGSVNAGGLGRCHRLCGPGRACPQGQRCDAWPGTHVCE